MYIHKLKQYLSYSMTIKRGCFASLAVGILMIFSQTAHAATIDELFNTGVDSSGAVLPLNSLDPHYSLSGHSSPVMVIDRFVGPASNQ